MSLWLCLRLSELPLQCLPRRGDGAAAVVAQRRLYCVNAAASLLGLEPGMDINSARAVAAGASLELLERQPDREREALDALCCWAYGITPTLHSARGDSLLLEIGGSLRLFGGVAAILSHCENGLTCQGYNAAPGLAPTPDAAWVVAALPRQRALDWERPIEQRLGELPLAALQGLAPEAITALRRSGLRRIGELFSLPPAALRRRCGETLITLLEALRSEQASPTTDYQPPDRFVDSYPLGYPLDDWQELEPAMITLLQSLQAWLRQRQLQTRCLRWQFLGQGRYRETLELRSSAPIRDWRDWQQLTRLRLERQPFREPVELLQLHSDELETLDATSGSLFASAGQREPAGRLLDRLHTRLGPQSVRALHCRDAHLPEHSLCLTAAGETPEGVATTNAAAQRPLWLLPEPEPLGESRTLRHAGRALELLYGPERLEDGWWSNAPASRDYYIARNAEGQRFWLFYERRQRRWFLHGVFP